jgi:hypothetical protein
MVEINKFSRQTLIEAVSLIEEWDHSKIERLILKFELEDLISYKQMNRPQIANAIGHHLISNGKNGQYIFGFVEHIAGELKEPKGDIPAFMGNQLFSDPGDKLKNSLLRDGYKIEDEKLKAIHPSAAAIAATENELRKKLDEKGYSDILSHLDRAVSSHTGGDWKAANRDLVQFTEKLSNKIDNASNPLFDTFVSYINPDSETTAEETTFRFQMAVIMGNHFLK